MIRRFLTRLFGVNRDDSPHLFGRAGEFAAVRHSPRGGWRLLCAGASRQPSETFRTRAEAFHGAAEIARQRGAHEADCRRIAAGVRW